MLDVTVSFFEALIEAARRDPDFAVLTFLDAKLRPTTCTYRQLIDEAVALGRTLSRQMPSSPAPVGILLRSQRAQVLHYLAVISLGRVPAILTPPNRKLNLQYYLENINATLATCGFAALITDLAGIDAAVTVLEPYSFREVSRGRDAGTPCPNDAALLQFSSGTTGLKRGVLVGNKELLLQLKTYAEAIQLAPSDCIMSWLPLYHDMGLMACLNMPLALGVRCVMMEPLDWVANPSSYLRAACDYRATLGWNPNFAYAFMAARVRPTDLDRLDLRSIRGLVNCSEPVTWESQRRFVDCFATVGLRPDVFLGCYAMAETTFALTHGWAGDSASLDFRGPEGFAFSTELPFVSTGRPLPGVELKIADSAGSAIPDRHLGEILVRSPFTFSGYHGTAASSELFIDGWYRTGDVGYRLDDQVFVCGRRKDMLIVGGINVFPQDLEEVAGRVAGVRPGRVVSFSGFDPGLQTEKVVVLAEIDAPAVDEPAILSGIRQRILSAFQIANFEVHAVPAGWLIKSSSGKMARRANKARWLSQEGRDVAGERTRTPNDG